MKKILIIDDEPHMRKMLRIAIESEGMNVLEAVSGAEGINKTALKQPNAILLDLGLPDMDGIEVLKRIREWSTTPIIVITVQDSPDEKIAVLDAGAQDYVTKPFHTGELLARIRAALKTTAASGSPIFQRDSVSVEFDSRTVKVGSEIMSLTVIEYAILRSLVKYEGRVVTKNQLVKFVWGDVPAPMSVDDSLRVHITSLRKKFKNYGVTNFIKTENGVGYRV